MTYVFAGAAVGILTTTINLAAALAKSAALHTAILWTMVGLRAVPPGEKTAETSSKLSEGLIRAQWKRGSVAEVESSGKLPNESLLGTIVLATKH